MENERPRRPPGGEEFSQKDKIKTIFMRKSRERGKSKGGERSDTGRGSRRFLVLVFFLRKWLLKKGVWGSDGRGRGISVKSVPPPRCLNRGHGEDLHENVLSSFNHHDPKPPRTGEGLDQGRETCGQRTHRIGTRRHPGGPRKLVR